MTSPKTPTPDNCMFALPAALRFQLDGQGTAARRTFAGVAYSGEQITNHWYWGNVIFELSSIRVPDKLPALVDHDRSKRAGYLTGSSINEAAGIQVQGILLSNESGKAVAQDSDDGFPWQMSVHIDPGRVDEVMPGVRATINGKEYTGPLAVFKDSVLKEVSFTATGWDSNTSATAMSRASGGNPQQLNSTGEGTMTPEQIAAMQVENQRLSTANATFSQQVATLQADVTKVTGERDTKESALKTFSDQRREADVKELFSVLKKDYKADDAEVKAFSAMPQDSFDMTAKMLKANQPAPGLNPALFSHSAQDGASRSAAPTATANPLLANAQARADSFKQSQQKR